MMVNRVESQRMAPLYRQAKELPKDVLLLIFDRLGETDLAKCRRVCRQWNVIGRDERLTKKFEKHFGACVWWQYFGRVGVEPPLPRNIKAIMNAECPFWAGKKVYETHLLVLIPRTVNGVPFTLDSLGEMVQKPKQGHATKCNHYWDELKRQYGNQSVARGYWVLVTQDVLPGSHGKSYSEQERQIKSYPGYEVPKLIEVATSVLMEYVKTGRFLYGQDPWGFTVCQEQVVNYRAVIGGFSVEGLSFSIDRFDADGVGAVRKF